MRLAILNMVHIKVIVMNTVVTFFIVRRTVLCFRTLWPVLHGYMGGWNMDADSILDFLSYKLNDVH